MIVLQLFSLAVIFMNVHTQSFIDSVRASMNAYDVRHYELSISFNFEKKTLRGTARVTFDPRKPLRALVLNADRESLTIDSVSMQGHALQFDHSGDLLRVSLPGEMPAHQSRSVTIHYHGVSDFHGEYDNGGVYFSTSDHLATMGEPNFARKWFPCKDLPSDKATATLHITVHDSLIAVSNGSLAHTRRGAGTVTYTWETRYPTATYLIAVSVAPYKILHDVYTAADGRTMNMQYYVFPDDSAKARTDFANTSKILSFFGRTFCEYPFLDEKFGYAEVDGELTMENQTICSIQRSLITGTDESETVIVHETAHQWWGNLITPKSWGDIWLSEGFATYAEALYREHAYGKESYQRYMNWLMSFGQGQFSGSLVNYTDTAFWSLFSPRIYQKGAIVLHMLRGVVGDSTFFTLMRAFLNDERLRYGNATTADFIETCERVCGRDLSWFFNEWVFASTDSLDRPEYSYRWDTKPNNGFYDVNLELTQTTAPRQLFTMPMSVTISAGQRDHLFTITDSLAVQSFHFRVPSRPSAIHLDKNNDVFKILRERSEH